jgi:anti-sigma factor RsiW
VTHPSLSSEDELALQRYLDGQLATAAAAAFAARLAAEPALAHRLDEAKALRAMFGRAAAAVVRPRAGFAAGVLAAVRRLPSRDLLLQAEQAEVALRVCRRLLLAAMLLAGIGLAWGSGLVGDERADTLQAAPTAEAQQELDRLDAILRSGAVDAGGGDRGVVKPGRERAAGK